jgi:predicted MFS family arabinose efflux permease
MFVLALRADELGLTPRDVGLLFGAGSVVPALIAIPLGSLIDRWGPRRSFILTALLTAALSVALGMVTEFGVLMALQLVMGCARTTAWVASQGYVTGLGRAEDRSTHASRFAFFVGSGQMLTAVMVGLVTELLGLRAGFLLGAVYSVLFTIVAWTLPEQDTLGRTAASRHRGGFVQAARLLRVPAIQVAMTMTFSRLWIVTTYTAFVPLILVGAGVRPAVIGAVVAVKGAVSTLTALAAGPLARRMGTVSVGVGSLVLGALGMTAAPWLRDSVTAFIPAALVGLAMGLSLPVILATLADGAQTEDRALSLSMRESANQVASSLAPPIIGRVIAVGGTGRGLLVAGASSVALLLFANARGKIAARRSVTDPIET